jgi:uncharacterized membrane protein YfcA
MSWLALPFALTALLYGAAGFGGGSTYTALLVLAGTDYRAVPLLSLMCNVLVVSIGTWRFARGGHLDLRRAWPLFVTSVPAAWIGGRMAVGEQLFVVLLGMALLGSGLAVLFQPMMVPSGATRRAAGRWVEPVAGAALGLLAGVVGIGGGIFLAPLLYLLRWDAPKRIAATCAAFILVNSLAGLAGQASRNAGALAATVVDHWLLFPAVAIGGSIGAAIGSDHIAARWVRMLTALLILAVALKLLIGAAA